MPDSASVWLLSLFRYLFIFFLYFFVNFFFAFFCFFVSSVPFLVFLILWEFFFGGGYLFVYFFLFLFLYLFLSLFFVYLLSIFRLEFISRLTVCLFIGLFAFFVFLGLTVFLSVLIDCVCFLFWETLPLEFISFSFCLVSRNYLSFWSYTIFFWSNALFLFLSFCLSLYLLWFN